MKKNIFRLIGAVIGIAAVLFFFTKLLMPTWFDWNTDNTVKGIYKEPRNRIQILFLGTSAYANGISPITLYNNYGFCAYNMGTPEQPLLSSYYWLQEVQRLHPETLNTVVLDSYFIFTQDPVFESSERALTHMKLSPIKEAAFKELSEVYEDVHPLNYLFPIGAYHTRWSQISEDDFAGLTGEKNFYFTRGQNAAFTMVFRDAAPSALDVPHYGITAGSDYPPEEYQKLWSDDDRYYFKKIVEFCREHQLNLILAAPFYSEYWDLQHDALQYYADMYNVPFLDFNLPELQEQIGLNYAYDYVNPDHPNILGAEKISDAIGGFIRSAYGVEDIRGKHEYDYLAAQAEAYDSEFGTAAKIMTCTDPEEYLSLIGSSSFSVFLAVRGDSAAGMTEGIRERLTALGLQGLAGIRPGYSYAGFRSEGSVIADMTAEAPEDVIILQGESGPDGEFHLTGTQRRTGGDGHFSITRRKGSFSVVSAGSSSGDYAKMNIDGTERSANGKGLNIIVYDDMLKSVIDSSCFDTASPDPVRTDLSLPEEYLERLEQLEQLKSAQQQ